MMTPELKTLVALEEASQNCFTLDLYNAYRTLPQEHIVALQKKGFWYVASATQGNITEAGCDALRAARK